VSQSGDAARSRSDPWTAGATTPTKRNDGEDEDEDVGERTTTGVAGSDGSGGSVRVGGGGSGGKWRADHISAWVSENGGGDWTTKGACRAWRGSSTRTNAIRVAVVRRRSGEHERERCEKDRAGHNWEHKGATGKQEVEARGRERESEPAARGPHGGRPERAGDKGKRERE